MIFNIHLQLFTLYDSPFIGDTHAEEDSIKTIMDADTNGDGKIDYKGLCLFLCRKKKNNNIVEIILIESLENSVLTIPSVCLYHKICYYLGMRMYLCTPRRICRTGCFLLSEVVLKAFRTLHKKTNRYQI